MTSLFADDSAVWRTGQNFNVINKELTSYLKRITEWCNKWGFKLNEDKTVALIFSVDKNILQTKLLITINGKQIQTVTHVKFIGITLDSKLNYNEHVTSLLTSCKNKT